MNTRKKKRMAFPLTFALSFLMGAGFAQDTTTTNEVNVTATRLTGDVFEQPYALYRHDREALNNNVGRTALDRMDHGPGVIIQHTAPGQTSPFIRGLTGNQSLLLLDGVRLSHATMRAGQTSMRPWYLI